MRMMIWSEWQGGWRPARWYDALTGRPELVVRLRFCGAVAGIVGTYCVVAGAALAGYLLWTVANALWIVVSVERRDWFAVAMFGCYQGATIYGLFTLGG